MEVLLKYGADPSIPNNSGLVPVEMTRNPYITELFMRDKANIFSPVVQARQLFGEYLEQHSVESRASNDSRRAQAGNVSHLNLEEEFDAMSLHSPDSNNNNNNNNNNNCSNHMDE